MLLKVPTIMPISVAITLELGRDTSIANIDL